MLRSDTFYKHSAWLWGWLCLAFEGFYSGAVLYTFYFPHRGALAQVVSMLCYTSVTVTHACLTSSFDFCTKFGYVDRVGAGGTVFPRPLFSGGGNGGSSRNAKKTH